MEKALLDKYSTGLHDLNFLEPEKSVLEAKGELFLRRIENAIGEIDTLREFGIAAEQMRPSLREAWAKLHKAHDEYKTILKEKSAITMDSENVYLDVMGMSLKESGSEIKNLFKGFIDKEFEWCETVNPFETLQSVQSPESEDLFRVYVTKAVGEGYDVKVETFHPSPAFPPKQFFRAKTQNIQAANIFAGMVSALLNDKLSRKELDTVNTIGLKPSSKYHEFGTISSKNGVDNGLREAVCQLQERSQTTSLSEVR